jgi:hypothetical protein
MNRPAALVWIDARQAIVLRWQDGPQVTKLDLNTPPHEKSVGHVRQDPGIRHGGGRAQARVETHRLEHLRKGLEQVVAAIPHDEDILVIGPGTVRDRLAAELTAEEGKRSPRTLAREIRTEAAPRLTEPQLVERLRELVGEPPRRIRPTGEGAPGER